MTAVFYRACVHYTDALFAVFQPLRQRPPPTPTPRNPPPPPLTAAAAGLGGGGLGGESLLISARPPAHVQMLAKVPAPRDPPPATTPPSPGGFIIYRQTFFGPSPNGTSNPQCTDR